MNNRNWCMSELLMPSRLARMYSEVLIASSANNYQKRLWSWGGIAGSAVLRARMAMELGDWRNSYYDVR